MSQAQLYRYITSVLKDLNIPFVDPCDAGYVGDCTICLGGNIAHPQAIFTQTASPFTWNTATQTGNLPLQPTLSFDSTTGNITYTLGDGSAPTVFNVKEDTSEVITTTPLAINGVAYPVGTTLNNILAALTALAHPAATITNNAAPFVWDSSTQTGNVPPTPSLTYNPITGELTFSPNDGTAPQIFNLAVDTGDIVTTSALNVNGTNLPVGSTVQDVLNVLTNAVNVIFTGPLFTVNAGTTITSTDNSLGEEPIVFGDILHFWSPDSTIEFNVTPGSAVVGEKLAQNGATVGQIMTWNGTSWVPQNLPAGADNWGTQVAQTDVTIDGDGTSGSPLTIAQQGAAAGQAIVWNGSSWTPTTIPPPTAKSGTSIVNGDVVLGSQNGVSEPLQFDSNVELDNKELKFSTPSVPFLLDLKNGRVGVNYQVGSGAFERELNIEGAIRIRDVYSSINVGYASGGVGFSSIYFGGFTGYQNIGAYFTGQGYATGFQNTGSYFNGQGFYTGNQNSGNNFNGHGYGVGQFNSGDNFNGQGIYTGYQNSGDNFNGQGIYTGYQNSGAYFNGQGFYAGHQNTGAYFNGQGFYAGHQNTGAYFNGQGFYAGYQNTGSHNCFYGSETNPKYVPASSFLSTFSIVATGSEPVINGVSVLSDFALLIGERKIFNFNGPNGPSNYLIKGVSATQLTIEEVSLVTTIPSSTYTISIPKQFDYSTALGYQTQIDKSEQIALGRPQTEEIKWADKHRFNTTPTVQTATDEGKTWVFHNATGQFEIDYATTKVLKYQAGGSSSLGGASAVDVSTGVDTGYSNLSSVDLTNPNRYKVFINGILATNYLAGTVSIGNPSWGTYYSISGTTIQSSTPINSIVIEVL